MRTLYLGELENDNLIPKLTFEYEPNEPGSVDYIEDRRIMRDGAVRMRLRFQSFSAQTVIRAPTARAQRSLILGDLRVIQH
ncbi:hypothetical protein [Streptomyces sp. NPDC051554]|uniref:hypothetical protein n=1 Tax=Streptomyces sp. NPDC051554 TaxID=3365656 RepID=UPI00379969FF